MTTYDVHAQNPTTCTCEDFERQATHANVYVCKHILATWIYKRALEQLGTPPVCEDLGQPAAAGATLPEAAFSLCLEGRLAGQDAQLTVRGQTIEEL